MARMLLVLALLASLGLGSSAMAQGVAAAPTDTAFVAPVDSLARAMPKPRSGWLYVLPVVAYSPETKLAFGASAGRYYRFSDDPDARPTTVTPLAIITTNAQLILGMFTDAWWAEDRWHLASNLGYTKFPTQFYGVGDDTPAAAEEDYTPRSAYFQTEVKRSVSGALYAGGLVDFKFSQLRDVADEGQLASGEIYGAEDGGIVGLGLTAAYDSRDAVFYPTRGWFHRLAVTRYLDILGGDYVYTRSDLNLTRYWSLGGSRVLAANLFGGFISGGAAPFYELQRLGLRGYFEERYLERNVVRGQVELRSGLWKWLGAAVFVGGGELAASVGGLRLDEVRPNAGFGLRFNVGGDQRANLRLDYGVGDGDSGVYVRFAEAF